MQTYTHFVMTAVLTRLSHRRFSEGRARQALPPVAANAALLGSIAPDLPLIALTAGFAAWDAVEQRQPSAPDAPRRTRLGWLFGELFFQSRKVKLVHNLFHAPLLTLLYACLGYWGWRRGYAWGDALFAFGLATSLHTLIDIPIHHNDGPLLLFPFDWECRFNSPVSYWDPMHYGVPFRRAEHAMLLGMLVWLGWDRWVVR